MRISCTSSDWDVISVELHGSPVGTVRIQNTPRLKNTKKFEWVLSHKRGECYKVEAWIPNTLEYWTFWSFASSSSKTRLPWTISKIKLLDSLDHFIIKHKFLSTSSLIQPSYTIRATIFEKVFRLEKFPKTEHRQIQSFLQSFLTGLNWSD